MQRARWREEKRGTRRKRGHFRKQDLGKVCPVDGEGVRAEKGYLGGTASGEKAPPGVGSVETGGGGSPGNRQGRGDTG